MAQGRVTKRAVDALQMRARARIAPFCGMTRSPGFGVAAFPTGRKVYVAQYRKDGRSRRITIGEHGRLTPDEARSQAKVILGRCRNRRGPHCRAPSCTRGSDLWRSRRRVPALARRRQAQGPDGRRIWSGCCAVTCLPAIGGKARRRRASRATWRGCTPACQTLLSANRAVALVSAIWNWAARRDEVALADNPAKGIERYPEQGRERFLTSAELSRLGDALRDAETIGLPWEVDESGPRAKHLAKPENRRVKLDPFAVAAIRLLILTGARLREILDAQWSQVDLERGVIFLSDSKTGKKPIYLSAAAQAVLASLPRIEGNPHIIAGAKEGAPRADLKKPWAAVKRAAGLEGVRLHDLRHSLRQLRGRGVAWPSDHREVARAFAGRDDASLRASRRGPAAPRCRHHRRDDLGGDGWEEGRGSCAA